MNAKKRTSGLSLLEHKKIKYHPKSEKSKYHADNARKLHARSQQDFCEENPTESTTSIQLDRCNRMKRRKEYT